MKKQLLGHGVKVKLLAKKRSVYMVQLRMTAEYWCIMDKTAKSQHFQWETNFGSLLRKHCTPTIILDLTQIIKVAGWPLTKQ